MNRIDFETQTRIDDDNNNDSWRGKMEREMKRVFRGSSLLPLLPRLMDFQNIGSKCLSSNYQVIRN